MTELLKVLLLPAVVVVVMALGPGIAVWILQTHRAWVRRQRRSPIGRELLRGPGHALREQLESSQGDLLGFAVLTSVLPMVLLSTFLIQAHLRGLPAMWGLWPVYLAMAVGGVVYLVYRIRRLESQLDRLRAGFDAELAVGQELDQLMRQGAHTFHDLPAEGFNIDHVVVAEAGVFAVETKGYTKGIKGSGSAAVRVAYDGKLLRFPSWSTAEPLEQAERQAQWLSRWLSSAAGDPVQALPVLALPGWFVERTGRGAVRVYSGKELVGLLQSRGTQRLSPEAVTRIAHQLDQRCRNVAPVFNVPQRKA